ncbi:MAG: FdhF/YdeP family oxidoreductase [Armatimonadetes bacterium]|nr:FdhF/YdeP family oxidoreductase [Armatimonadota bacterium]
MEMPESGGGWQAIGYTLRKAREVGPGRLWKAMTSRNACKTCALGMGGQSGGMRNEAGHFPEVCKKSLQAMTADMQGAINPQLFKDLSIDQLKSLTSRELESLGRLTVPIVYEKGSSHYREATWEEALEASASAIKATSPERLFFYASGRSSNEAGFLLQLFARALGTNHVSNCSYYCHQASGVGLKDALGTGTATIDLSDLEQSDLVILIGGNPASNHPRLMTTLVNLRERGGHVIVVNPVKETGLVNFRVPSKMKSLFFGSEIASVYIQPKIGGDIAFLCGVAKHVLESGAHDQSFLDQSTEGFEAVRSYLDELAWGEIEAASGVTGPEIERAAQLFSTAKKAVIAWTMGVTHHVHGVENVHWIANLALLRGMVGRPGAGLLPIRGHSNVQGMGSTGVSPQLAKAAVEGLAALGVEVPQFRGHDTIAAVEAADRSELDTGFCLGGNLFGATPDADFAGRALGKVKTLVYLSTTLNTGHVHGLAERTIVLPVLARDEDPQATTQESMFSYVRLSEGGPRRHDGPRAEVDVLCDIADLSLGSQGALDWSSLKDHDAVRALIPVLVPNLASIQNIGQTKREFVIPGRILHTPEFETPSGKAVMHADPIPVQAPLGHRQVMMMTVRSEGQFNTVVYEEEDIYRGQERRDVILLNERDMARFGLEPDSWVKVENGTGSLEFVLARPFDIAEGCALMYYPEANVLVPRTADPRSKTPAYKAVIVTLSPSKRRPV